jgi:hypothetical protein
MLCHRSVVHQLTVERPLLLGATIAGDEELVDLDRRQQLGLKHGMITPNNKGAQSPQYQWIITIVVIPSVIKLVSGVFILPDLRIVPKQPTRLTPKILNVIM